MNSKFGERIKAIREGVLLSQEEIAKLFGLTQSHWSGLETGKILPSLFLVCSMSLAFDLYPDWLVLGADDNKAPNIKRITRSIRTYKTLVYFEETGILLREEEVQLYLNDFSIRLKEHRKKNKITQDDLKKRFGIARSSYSLIEKGKSSVYLDTLITLINGMNVSADWLLFGIEPSQKEIISPRELYPHKTVEEIEFLYNYKRKRRFNETRERESINEIELMEKEKNIPFRNLTRSQIVLVCNLIQELEIQNRE